MLRRFVAIAVALFVVWALATPIVEIAVALNPALALRLEPLKDTLVTLGQEVWAFSKPYIGLFIVLAILGWLSGALPFTSSWAHGLFLEAPIKNNFAFIIGIFIISFCLSALITLDHKLLLSVGVDTLKAILTWPVIFLIAILAFRHPLKELIPRLRELAAKGPTGTELKATFEQQERWEAFVKHARMVGDTVQLEENTRHLEKVLMTQRNQKNTSKGA
jgi:hypothetical protein